MVLHSSFIYVAHNFRQLDLVEFRLGLPLSIDVVVLQEEFQGLDNIVDIIEFIMFHAVAQKHMGRTLSESLAQHLQRVMKRYHRVLYAMEYDCGTFYVLGSLKVVESLLDKQINYPAIFHSRDIFNRFYRTNKE